MIKKILLSIVIVIASLFIPVMNTYAAWSQNTCNLPNSDADPSCNGSSQTVPGLAIVIINIVIGVLGIAAVAFIIVSGYRYTTAQGDPAAVAKARNGIIFSVAGLIVAILAFAIVNFVSQSIFS